MALTGFDLYMGIVHLIIKIVLLLVLVRKDRIRQFPIFSAWVVEGALDNLIAFFVDTHFSHRVYLNYFCTVGILNECLQLLVLYEIATHVFAPTGRWAVDVRRTLVGMAGLSALVAALFSLLANPATPSAMQTFLLRSNFLSALLMSELFVCMVVLSATVGLPWKTHAARIAQGLGAYSLFCVALGIAKMFYGLKQDSWHVIQLNHARSVFYFACEVYWVFTLWAEAPAPSELPEAMRIQIYTLQRQVENDLIRIRSWRRN